ncbi:MAG: hypothetical protein ACRDYA_13255 [Egibacteraceae bacterium]
MCPAQALGPGAFDVVDRPSSDSRYDPAIGHRVNTTTGVAVCVHPFRVGLPPGRYASGGDPLPGLDEPAPEPTAEALELPEDVTDLEAWLVATLRAAQPSVMASALARAEAIANERFASKDVVAAMRRVLTCELAGR